MCVLPIIPPVATALLEQELTAERLLRVTNKAGNEIYVFTAEEAPHCMQEVGRLREEAFRHYGGGTGKAVDIDEFDTMPGGYRQLIVWDPENKAILGGYRFIYGSEVGFSPDGKPLLATAEMFDFSDAFLRDYLPNTVELGRSFVSLQYQSTRMGTKAIFVLDNLWDGIGALTVVNPDALYFYGKVTMFKDYNCRARNLILHFLRKHFPDPDRLVTPIHPLPIEVCEEDEALFSSEDFGTNYKRLNTEVRKLGINIPPLVSAYIALSPEMRVFGTAVNEEFGDVEETGIFIAVGQILEEKKQRHIESFVRNRNGNGEAANGHG